MLGIAWVAGLVITPACDLQNNKSDSVTYLPIVPIRKAFTLRGFLPEVIRAIDGQLEVLSLDPLSDSTEKFVPVEPRVLDEVLSKLNKRPGRTTRQKELDALSRVRAGISVLRLAYGIDKDLPQ